jgi:hypothetical protein
MRGLLVVIMMCFVIGCSGQADRKAMMDAQDECTKRGFKAYIEKSSCGCTSDHVKCVTPEEYERLSK